LRSWPRLTNCHDCCLTINSVSLLYHFYITCLLRTRLNSFFSFICLRGWGAKHILCLALLRFIWLCMFFYYSFITLKSSNTCHSLTIARELLLCWHVTKPFQPTNCGMLLDLPLLYVVSLLLFQDFVNCLVYRSEKTLMFFAVRVSHVGS